MWELSKLDPGEGESWEEGLSRSWDSKCKVPEAGPCLAGVNNREGTIAGWDEPVEKEDRRAGWWWGRWCRSSWTMGMALAFTPNGVGAMENSEQERDVTWLRCSPASPGGCRKSRLGGKGGSQETWAETRHQPWGDLTEAPTGVLAFARIILDHRRSHFTVQSNGCIFMHHKFIGTVWANEIPYAEKIRQLKWSPMLLNLTYVQL